MYLISSGVNIDKAHWRLGFSVSPVRPVHTSANSGLLVAAYRITWPLSKIIYDTGSEDNPLLRGVKVYPCGWWDDCEHLYYSGG